MGRGWRGRRGGNGLCIAVPGLQRQGREAVASASFARVRKPCGAARLALPRASACAQRPGAQGRRLPPPTRPNREACSAAAREKRPLDPQTGRLPSRPAGPGLPRGVPRRPRRFRAHLTSFGSRPVSLRIFSSTFLRLSLAFSSCSCKVLTATAIFSLQRAPRLLDRPRSAAPRRARRQTRKD